jgi:hypothetical protein
MSIISAIIGSVAASGGPAKTATWYGIDFDPVQEGQQQHAQVQFTNWDNSTVYWTVVGSLNSYIGGQLVSYNGTLNPGSGNSIQDIYFTFNADQTTDGPLTYYVNIGSSVGNYDLASAGPFTCRDSSQSPALVLDVDPASLGTMYGLTGWADASGQGNNIYIGNGSTSTNNGGTLVFNGTTTYAGDIMNNNLTSSVYGTITLSAWIKPTTVTGATQAIIAKELCYKLEITTNGSIAWMTGKGYNPWEVTVYANPGLVTTSTWSNIVATVDANYTRIYVNGVKVTETSGNIIGANGHAFNIGAYDSTNDLFAGSMGEIKVWNYAITEAAVISQYNSTAARYGATVIPQSLDFPAGNPYLLVSNTQSDWNLGSTYTIEFWSRETNASTSDIRTVMSQGPGNGIDLGFISGGTLFRNTQNPGIAEPTPGVWTHVAFVGNSDNVYIYHNGVLQGTALAPGALGNGSNDLNIGRRAGVNGQGFLGKLAMVRVSTTAKYSTTFTPSYSYGVEADTRLLLGNDPLTDSTGNHPVSVQGAVTASTDFPSYQSLVFNQPEGDYLSTPASSDWNLGTTYTIEFWINANNASGAGIHIPGGQWGLINQTGWYGGMQNNSILIGMAAGNLTIAQDPNNAIEFAEPTAGVWTHVALVNNGGGSAQKVYYNGVEQTKTSGSYQSNGWTNTTADLYIGRLAPNYASHFDGKMAMVRISNTAKYLAPFTATTTYGVESDTVLFLGKVNPLVDGKSHTITNNGTTLSNSFPS